MNGPCPYVIPAIGTEVTLTRLSDCQKISGTIDGTSYKFRSVWRFPFLEKGKNIENLISVRCDSVKIEVME